MIDQPDTLPPLMAALSRIPMGSIYAVKLNWPGVTVAEIKRLRDAGLVASMRVGLHSPAAIHKDPALAYWYRTEAGDKALTDALNGGD